MDISKAIRWNEKVGNMKGVIDYDLEIKMLNEELVETFNAMKEDDKKEIIDGLIDTMFVAVGSLHKLGLDESQVNEAWEEVCNSNESKLPFEKDEDGKVKKNKNFIPPNFSNILARLGL